MPSIGLPTLLVFAVAGGGAFLIGLRNLRIPMVVLLVGVIFRDLSSRWLFAHTELSIPAVTAIGRWWFAVILGMLAVAGIRWLRRGQIPRLLEDMQLADYVFILAVGVTIVSTFLSPQFDAAVTSARGYLQPMAVYVLARIIRPTKNELRLLLGLLIAVGIVMAVFGLWQTMLWDEADYRAEGYVRQDGDLVSPSLTVAGSRYIRPSSTVSGPNEFGLDMVILFALAFMTGLMYSGRLRVLSAITAILFITGLILSFSRSGLLAFVLALAILLVLSWRLVASGREFGRKEWLWLSAAAVALLVTLVAVFALTGFDEFLARTLESLSRQYHIRDTLEAIDFLSEQPEGVGMGLVEPKGALGLIESGGAYHVEGSLLQIAMEMGVWGLAVWVFFWLAAVWKTLRTPLDSDQRILVVFTGAAGAAWIGSLAAFTFLPLMQSISLMVWLWFLLGLGVSSTDIELAWARDDETEIERLETVSA